MASGALVGVGRGRVSVGGTVRRAWARLQVMARARATRRLLLDMDPRELADIGIGRAEALMEARRSFWDVERRRRG